MELEQIIKIIKDNEAKILNIWSKNDWRFFKQYIFIKEKFLSNQIDEQFKGVFCSFYALNGAGGLNKPQKDEFFKILFDREVDLEKILKRLYGVAGYRNKKKMFLSFSTKLIHTVNESLPIYDRNIAKILGLPNQTHFGSFEDKLKNRLSIYATLKEQFNKLLSNKEIKSILLDFRKKLKNETATQSIFNNTNITDSKLLDSILWTLYFSIFI